MRRSPLRRKTPMLGRRCDTGPDRHTVEAVYERAQWHCELCGDHVGDRRGTDHHLHHRRPRAAGGSRRPDTNSPANLLVLCPPCHSGVESQRALALENGWLLPQVADPARCAVLIDRHSQWVYLTADGRYADNPPETS